MRAEWNLTCIQGFEADSKTASTAATSGFLIMKQLLVFSCYSEVVFGNKLKPSDEYFPSREMFQ